MSKPENMDQAAESLGICRRNLTEYLKRFPYFELRGRKKVFYPEHISKLRREIHECALQSNGITDGPMLTGLAQMAEESDALSRLKTLAGRKN